MITFVELQDGAQFVWGDLMFIKTPPAPIGECDECGIGINALAIGRRNGSQLMDRFGYPMLPWGTHFCPGEQVDAHNAR